MKIQKFVFFVLCVGCVGCSNPTFPTFDEIGPAYWHGGNVFDAFEISMQTISIGDELRGKGFVYFEANYSPLVAFGKLRADSVFLHFKTSQIEFDFLARYEKNKLSGIVNGGGYENYPFSMNRIFKNW